MEKLGRNDLWTTRAPRFTLVSDGKPFRRLLLRSKAILFASHDNLLFAVRNTIQTRAAHSVSEKARLSLTLAALVYPKLQEERPLRL